MGGATAVDQWCKNGLRSPDLIPNDQWHASEVSKLDCLCRFCEYIPSHPAAEQSKAAGDGPKALYKPNVNCAAHSVLF